LSQAALNPQTVCPVAAGKPLGGDSAGKLRMVGGARSAVSGSSPRSWGLRRIIFVLSVLFFVATSVRAEKIKDLKPSGYVNDFAGVLTDRGRQRIESLCTEVEQKTGAQIAVVTINSLGGNSIDEYANDLYKQWGIGPKSNDRGVLILFAIHDHRYRTEVGYGLEAILPDGKVGDFGRQAVPLLRQGNYDAAAYLMARRVADVIAGQKNVTLTGEPAESARRQTSDQGNIGNLVFIFLFFGLWFLASIVNLVRRMTGHYRGPRGGGRGMWGGPWIGGMGGWGGGGWGGGGFGGGGGGFGGFGGGISGGGGASGGW
jgi:uncharacterized protein